METIIEESIWSIREKMPLRKAIFKLIDGKITRQLIVLGESEWFNNKIDIIDLENTEIKISLSKINSLSPLEISNFLKEKAKNFEPELCFERNVNNEIPSFLNPIVTRLA